MTEAPVLHWFRRDLRLQDNTALNAALESGASVIGVFVLDDAILKSDNLGVPRLKLMLDALHALDTALRDHNSRLLMRRGQPERELKKLVSDFGVSAIYTNADYTPFAQRRDDRVAEAVGVPVHLYDDVVIHAPGQVMTQTGGPYSVYTPFKKNWWTLAKPLPRKLAKGTFKSLTASEAGSIPSLDNLHFKTTVEVPDARPEIALQRLDDFITGPIFDYADGRNRLEPDPFADATASTSALSAYLRLGMLSPRQAWAAGQRALKAAKGAEAKRGVETWLAQLAWRDFYLHVMAHFPHVVGHAFRPEYEALPYRRAPKDWAAWEDGQTGYPVVDAAMRQLHSLGWMHNRARMIVASFLTKHQLIDWRMGERHFMQWLIDGDPSNNNGGWQWAAGTGTDAQPFFRIFNPTSQSQKFDRDGAYIRHWLPELRDVPNDKIHEPWTYTARKLDYPPPIVDLAFGRERALDAFEKVKQHKSALEKQ
jgi:deoxyribodipyrimidine photo-lyase